MEKGHVAHAGVSRCCHTASCLSKLGVWCLLKEVDTDHLSRRCLASCLDELCTTPSVHRLHAAVT